MSKKFLNPMITGLFLAAASSASANLVHYWSFDENSGTSVADSISSVNGTLAGDTAFNAPGQAGTVSSLDFDGSGDFVDLGDNVSFGITDSFTITAWLRGGNATGAHAIFSKMDASSPFRGYQFGFTGGDILEFLAIDTWNTDVIQVQGSTDVDTGSWVHVAMTYDGSAEGAGVELYVNGVAEITNVVRDTLTASSTITNSVSASIASRGAGNFQDLDGGIDEVAIWNTALSAGAVADVFVNGVSVIPEPSDYAGVLGLMIALGCLARRRIKR